MAVSISGPTPTSRSRTWRSGSSSFCSAATRCDRGLGASIVPSGCGSRSGGQGWREALHVVRPETVIRWHRQGFPAFWTWRSRRGRKGKGRPSVSSELTNLIRNMALANPHWGAPRIHGELLKLGFDVSQRTVARLMPRRPRLYPLRRGERFSRTTSPSSSLSTFSSYRRRPSVCSTYSSSCCTVAAKSCTST